VRALKSAVDVYGFDDEPMPPRSEASAFEDEGPEAAPSGTPLYPKRAGLFPEPSRSSKSSSGGGELAVKIVVRVVLGLVGGFAGLVATAVGIPGLRSFLIPGGWSTRSQIEAFVKRQVDLTNELTGILRAVNDVPTASENSARANATLRKMTENLKTNKDRKGNQRDIEQTKQKYLFDQNQALQSFLGEIQRLASMPGVLDALAIQGSLLELAAVEETIPGINKQVAFTPPANPLQNFRAPPAPVIRPVQLPGTAFNPQPPGFGPQGPTIRPPGLPSPPAMPRPTFSGPRGRFRPGSPGPG
jgi:hypothetical protein